MPRGYVANLSPHLDRIREMVIEGRSNREIAAAFGVHRTTVADFLADNGIIRSRPNIDHVSPDQIRAWKLAGQSDAAIGRTLGVSDWLVRDFRHKHGIAQRVRQEPVPRTLSVTDEIRRLCTDRNREGELYAGRRYEDDPTAPVWEPKLRPVPVDWQDNGRRL